MYAIAFSSNLSGYAAEHGKGLISARCRVSHRLRKDAENEISHCAAASPAVSRAMTFLVSTIYRIISGIRLNSHAMG